MPHSRRVTPLLSREVERADLALIEAPPATTTWFPIKHADVLDAVIEALTQSKLEIENMRLVLIRHDARFFGTLSLRSPIADGVTLVVGVRNSINQSLPLCFMAGSRVTVGSNFAFRSDLLVSRKHTLNAGARFREDIAQAVGELESFRADEARRVEQLRATEIDDIVAESLMLRAYENQIVSSRLLPCVIRGWRKPVHEDFKARSMWSLYNAFTAALADRMLPNPQVHATLTMRLTKLLTPSET